MLVIIYLILCFNQNLVASFQNSVNLTQNSVSLTQDSVLFIVLTILKLYYLCIKIKKIDVIMTRLFKMMIFLLLSFYGYSQSYLNPNSRESYNLNGKVKNVEYINCVLHIEKDTLIDEREDKENRSLPPMYMCFDRNGVETERNFLNIDLNQVRTTDNIILKYEEFIVKKYYLSIDNLDTVCIGTYILNEEGDLIGDSWYMVDEGLVYESEYNYADNGLLKNKSIYTPNISDPEKIDFTKIKYAYSKDNLVVQEDYFDQSGVKTQTKKHIYNSDKKIVQTEITNLTKDVSKPNVVPKRKIQYDSKGNVISRHVVKSKEEIIESEIKYDKRQNIKVLKLYESDGRSTKIKNKYKNNHLKKSAMILPNGKNRYVLLSKSDSDGKLVSTKMIYKQTPENNMNSTYVYEYDNQGNWITRSELSDGKVKLVTKRKIEYYD